MNSAAIDASRFHAHVGNVSLHGLERSISLRAMSFLRCSLLLLCVALAGCRPGTQGVVDEQKEPYFLAGKRRIQERDPAGAIEYFEKALDVNPRSASAHLELGMLFEKQDPADYAAALYHYKRALDIRPDVPSADLIKARMEDCKRELAKSVVQLPTMEMMQRRIDALAAENQSLRLLLQGQPANAARVPGASTSAVQVPPAAVAPRTSTPVAPQTRPDPLPTVRNNGSLPNPTTTSTRVHTVAPGETLGSIAKRYNVRLPALQSANPTVDARKLRQGQTLVIPPPAP
jgi:LysM repeat protein